MIDAPTSGGGARFLRSFLDRFRRVAGVPATARDDVAAELAPLFAALAGLEQEAQAIERSATEVAAARAHAATEEIELILRDAVGQAEAERADAIKAGRRAAEAAAAEIVRAAEAEAERVRAEGRRRLPGIAAEVLGCVTEGRR
jgi:hypothetical protein